MPRLLPAGKQVPGVYHQEIMRPEEQEVSRPSRLLVGALVLVAAFAVVQSLPEILRYLKMRDM